LLSTTELSTALCNSVLVFSIDVSFVVEKLLSAEGCDDGYILNTWLKFLLRISPGEINWLLLLLQSKPIFVDTSPVCWKVLSTV
jgi:hypothetical protein